MSLQTRLAELERKQDVYKRQVREICGNAGIGEDVVAMLVLADIEGGEGAVEPARRDDRDLAHEGDEAFENRGKAPDRFMSLGEVAARRDLDLALSLIHI